MPLRILYLVSETLAEKVQIPEDQVRMLLSLIFCIPLGFLFRVLPNQLIRDIYGVVFGLLLQYFVYGEGIFVTLLQSSIVYFLIVIFGRKSAKLVFIESLLFQSFYHIYRQIVDYGGWKLDISTIVMMYTCKYTSFAYCYEDGGKPIERLSEDQKERRIEKLPNILSYLSYVYFFAGSLIGPAYDFVEYRDFIHQRKMYSNIPNSFIPMLKSFIKSLFFMAITVLFSSKYPIEFCGTDAYGSEGILYQFYYFNVAITLARCRYYSGWTMAQIGIDASGFSYGGVSNGVQKWDNILTADPFLELLSSPKEKIDKWNASVASWLRRYVYFRIYSEADIKKSPGKGVAAQNATYVVSALWHGFYPSYYISFIHWGFVSTAARYFYKLSLNYPNFDYNNPVYKVVRFFFPNFMLNYYGIAFLNLRVTSVLKFFNSGYWIPSILLYGVMAFFLITGFGQKTKKKAGPESVEHKKNE